MPEQLRQSEEDPIKESEILENPVLKVKEELPLEVLKEIMAKVEHVEKQDNVAFHTVGFIERTSLPAGLLHAENILNQGILSKKMAAKANIKRSSTGFQPESSYTGNDRNAGGIFGYSKLYLRKNNEIHNQELFIVFRYDESKSQPDDNSGLEDGIVTEQNRIKPKDILGIEAGQDTLKMTLLELFEKIKNSDLNGMHTNALRKHNKFLNDATRLLSINFVNDEKEKIEELNKEIEKAPDSYYADLKAMRKNPLSNKLKEDILEANARTAIILLINKKLEILEQYILEHPRFQNGVTVEDFLIKLCKEYKIPLFSNGARNLIWPEK